MKNIMYLFACLALVLGCKPNVEKPKEQLSEALALKTLLEIACQSNSDTASISSRSLFGISLDTAKEYIKCYHRNQNFHMLLDSPIAFTINSKSFFETMDISAPDGMENCYIRAYIGLDSINKAFHLLFTPVRNYNTTDYGRDVILTGPYGNEANGPYMLNFSAPCPNACPSKSQSILRDPE